MRTVQNAIVATALVVACQSKPQASSAGAPAVSAVEHSAPAARAERVTFDSGGVNIVGVLYSAAERAQPVRRPAVLVAGPWLNVKEQVATNYAHALSERGLTALVIDFRYWGESGGEPRQYESATAKIDDIEAAVRYLRSRPDIDPERIDALGVCFGAGHVIAAATKNESIRSVATVAAWLHDGESLVATFGQQEIDRRYRVGRAAQEAWKASKRVDTVPASSTTDKTAAMLGVDYYSEPGRGAVPQWTNAMATMSWPEWLDFDAVALAPSVKQPILMVHSDGSALPDNVRKFHALVKAPKDLYWTQGKHTDFYDRPPFVAKAADAVAAHFRRANH